MEYNLVSNFNERIKEIYSNSNLTQQDFATKIGITRSLLNRYLNRGDNAKAEKIVQIANNLNINPLYLIGCDVPINSSVTKENIFYDIPFIKNISFDENIFSIKNIDKSFSNVVDLDVDYQYFYCENENKLFLIQIKSHYTNDETIAIVDSENEFRLTCLDDLKNQKYKILGKVILIKMK